MLDRKLLVGQRPSFPHRDLTLGSGHGVKTGLPCCLETVSLRAIYVYPFVLKEVKKKNQLPLIVFQLCGLMNDACNVHLKKLGVIHPLRMPGHSRFFGALPR